MNLVETFLASERDISLSQLKWKRVDASVHFHHFKSINDILFNRKEWNLNPLI